MRTSEAIMIQDCVVPVNALKVRIKGVSRTERRKLVVDFLRETSHGQIINKVTENKHSRPGSPLYERFFATWVGARMKCVILAYHGTAESNINAIL